MRKNFKHGKWVKAPVPHADIEKYVDKQTLKEADDKPGSRSRKSGSTMEFKKPKKSRGPSAGRQAQKEIKVSNTQAGLSRGKHGGRAGYQSGKSVTRFRSSGPEGKPHSTKEGRSAEAQRAYMRKFGPQEPRRKRIWPKRAKKAEGGRTNLLEELGRVEGEHSNRNRRAEVSRIHGELNKGYSLGGSVGAAKRGFNKKILRKS